MARKTGNKPLIKSRFKKHTIEIQKQNGKERLLIDGVPYRHAVCRSGYTLLDNAYSPPRKTLQEAAKAFVSEELERKQD